MRVLARRHGAAYSLGEVLIDQFVLTHRPGRSRTRHHLRITDEEHPIGGQLMGADPQQFALAALRLVEAGFDVIDINFGCPVRSAMGGCRGGYHLGQPDVAVEIVRRVRDAVLPRIPVTLKMRRGIDDSSESRDRFFTILDGAFAHGVAAVTVHGRTVHQGYRGPSDWQFLRAVKSHVGGRTILGSGDLFSAEDCIEMMAQTGVDGVSIARGAIGNPWIFKQTRSVLAGEELPPPPTVRRQEAVIAEHFALAADTYGLPGALRPMKTFGIQYARLHPDHVEVRDSFVRVQTVSDWNEVLQRHYTDDRPGQYPRVDELTPAESHGRTNPGAHRL
jgi:nifR3 family TIM-barrel protein